MAPTSDQSKEISLYQELITLQRENISEFNRATMLGSSHIEFSQLLGKIITDFQAYMLNRSRMARVYVSPFFVPTWCPSVERSILWIGGCRPSSYMILVYAFCEMEFESKISEFHVGGQVVKSVGFLTGRQWILVDELRRKTIKDETKLSAVMASLQGGLMENPLETIDEKSGSHTVSEAALDEHSRAMMMILEEANRLRERTVQENMKILMPQQEANFLATSNKQSLCVQEWGKNRDLHHGRN